MRLRWLKAGTRSLHAVHAYVAIDDPEAARRLVKRIRSSVFKLETFPSAGRAGTIPGTRELIVTGLPYLVIYRLKADQVEILRVFHTARDRPELMS